MPSKEFQLREERRAYYRLLRYLLNEEVRSFYTEEQEPLPPRMSELLEKLEGKTPRSMGS